jgi:hypothetical protein
LHARIAANRREWTAAFELVYRCYLAKGYIQPHPGRIVYQATFGLPTSRTIIATNDVEDVVGTLTVVGDNPLGLQLETTYPCEVQSLRSRGRRVAEITCLAVWPTRASQPRAVLFAITHFLFHYARWRRYDDLLMAIHPSHRKFYQHCFGAELLGPLRPNKAVGGNPSVCYRIDLHWLKCRVNPKLLQQYEARMPPETHYMVPAIQPEDHQYFCTRRGVVPVGVVRGSGSGGHGGLGQYAA